LQNTPDRDRDDDVENDVGSRVGSKRRRSLRSSGTATVAGEAGSSRSPEDDNGRATSINSASSGRRGHQQSDSKNSNEVVDLT
jgi:hypothetical protein